MTRESYVNRLWAMLRASEEQVAQLRDEVEQLKATRFYGRYEPMRVTVTPRPDGLYEITGTKFTPPEGDHATD